jgi:uncharacterized membrane protein YvbJ
MATIVVYLVFVAVFVYITWRFLNSLPIVENNIICKPNKNTDKPWEYEKVNDLITATREIQLMRKRFIVYAQSWIAIFVLFGLVYVLLAYFSDQEFKKLILEKLDALYNR